MRKMILFILVNCVVFISIILLSGCGDGNLIGDGPTGISPENKVNVIVAMTTSSPSIQIDSAVFRIINITQKDTAKSNRTTISDTLIPLFVNNDYIINIQIFEKTGTVFEGNVQYAVKEATSTISIPVKKKSTPINISLSFDSTAHLKPGDTIYFNDIENPLGDEWETGYKQDTIFSFLGNTSLQSNPYGVKLSSNADALLDIDLRSAVNPTISFWIRNIMGYFTSVRQTLAATTYTTYYDKTQLGISCDFGVTWETVMDTCFSNSEFSKITIPLSKFAGMRIKIRFRYAVTSAHDVKGEGFWIDNLLIQEKPY